MRCSQQLLCDGGTGGAQPGVYRPTCLRLHLHCCCATVGLLLFCCSSAAVGLLPCCVRAFRSQHSQAIGLTLPYVRMCCCGRALLSTSSLLSCRSDELQLVTVAVYTVPFTQSCCALSTTLSINYQGDQVMGEGKTSALFEKDEQKTEAVAQAVPMSRHE